MEQNCFLATGRRDGNHLNDARTTSGRASRPTSWALRTGANAGAFSSLKTFLSLLSEYSAASFLVQPDGLVRYQVLCVQYHIMYDNIMHRIGRRQQAIILDAASHKTGPRFYVSTLTPFARKSFLASLISYSSNGIVRRLSDIQTRGKRAAVSS